MWAIGQIGRTREAAPVSAVAGLGQSSVSDRRPDASGGASVSDELSVGSAVGRVGELALGVAAQCGRR
ncbi:MAG: hypothetical protein ABS81_27065 [Pseudonocardia sp. SCN 72-86]|nr:MAG: hypothetical protein ABS81_27065 [Pseudonocardia sp. SCN 72-86]